MIPSSLPHGPSFRFVDQVTQLDPGVSATAIYHFHGGESFLPGHFPGNPIMPAVILIEMIAQLGGIIAQSDKSVPPLNDLRLAGVAAAKILAAAVPGQEMEITARIEARMGNLVQISGQVTCAGKPIAKAKVTLSGS